MGYVLMGHGGMPAEHPSPYMDVVSVPGGTTIQFYSHACQGLVYGPEELDRWDRICAPWPALGSDRMTYNLLLQGDPDCYEDNLASAPRLGGHTLVRPGFDGVPDPIRLCHGTPETCPPQPGASSGTVHACDGVLGRFRGELHWLACTAIEYAEADGPSLAAALTGLPPAVVLGDDPDRCWNPREADLRVIARINRDAVDSASPGQTLHCCGGGAVFLVAAPDGWEHDSAHCNFALCQSDPFDATLTVHRGDGGSVLVVADVPAGLRGSVRSAVERFHDGELHFT